ncbi:tubulin-binding prefolding complex subunit YKE2 [Ascoidea rubescens DSM 1968]|uniref:Prefoldin n=1 Tax=Ascoidea rubescens DSM 1968 TaxID=1344418 RepID=A0A1D2VQ25_9ASCO|nr:Prefoldin [Ascoidea rubescens DSM 1968]ODV63684.1 Prefoldin [Ascoidea rubescens DSM 1968]
MATEREQFEQISADYAVIQKTMNELIISRQKLETQYQENKIVKDEFDILEKDPSSSSNKLYKLIGSILIPTNLADSQNNINKRITYIQSEISSVELKIKAQQAELETKREAILRLRSKIGSGVAA